MELLEQRTVTARHRELEDEAPSGRPVTHERFTAVMTGEAAFARYEAAELELRDLRTSGGDRDRTGETSCMPCKRSTN